MEERPREESDNEEEVEEEGMEALQYSHIAVRCATRDCSTRRMMVMKKSCNAGHTVALLPRMGEVCRVGFFCGVRILGAAAGVMARGGCLVSQCVSCCRSNN